MATEIKLSDEVLAQAQTIASQEGKTIDDLAAEAFDILITDRYWKRIQREAIQRRGEMTDDEVQEYVDQVIHEYRAETHGR